MMSNVFVYGTLKYPDVLERVLNRPYKGVIYPAQLNNFFCLHDLGSFPGLAPDPKRHLIRGKIIELSEEDVESLDVYESVESNLYTREIQFVYNCATKQSVSAYVYILCPAMCSEVNKMRQSHWERP